MRRLGCWLLAAGLVVLSCLAASGCAAEGDRVVDKRAVDARAMEICAAAGGAPQMTDGRWYVRCDFPPQPCGPLPAEGP